MFYAIRHALRGINRRKLKNIINTIGILIGVSLLAGVQIATDSLVNGMNETVRLRYGNADILIQKGEYQTAFFNYSVYEHLANDSLLAEQIDGIAPRIMSQVSITTPVTTKQTEPIVTVVGINRTLDASFGELKLDSSIVNNNFDFDDLGPTQCFVADRLAESVIEFGTADDGSLELDPFLNPIEMSFVDAQGEFQVRKELNAKGVVDAKGKGVLRSGLTVFMKLEYLQTLFNTTGINSVVISTTQENANAELTKTICEEQLIFYEGQTEGENFTVDPQKLEAFRDIAESINTFRIILYVFGSLIIISGVLLILNITLMNIDERERSIGIMRAIGMTQRQLVTVLITESAVLGGIGSALGVGAGLLNGYGIIILLENFLDIGEILTNIPLIVNPIGLVISFVIGLIISLLAALYPAWKASRIDIVETINEIETPQTRVRTGSWSSLLGSLLIIAGIACFITSLLIAPDWRWMMFIGSILGFLLGLGFTFSNIISARIAFNSFSIAWMVAGLLSVLSLTPYMDSIGVADDMALYTFLISMLGLVFGSIIFIALNLEWISDRFNALFQRIKQWRSIGLISMRYVGKKKTRSALTFAIFGVILTMNVFLAVFTGSFTLGFDDFADNELGGVDIIAYSPFGAPAAVEDPIATIKGVDSNVIDAIGVKFKFSLSGASSYIPFAFTNASGTYKEDVPIPTDVWGISQEFLDFTEYPLRNVWDGIGDADPWQAAMNASNKYIILPNLLQEYSFDEGGRLFDVNITSGDQIAVPDYSGVNGTETLANYTVIAFVETTSYSTLFSSFLFTSENSSILGNIFNDTAYLISVDQRLRTDQVVELSRDIEAELLGFDTISLRDRIEQLMDFVRQSVSFMQAFLSLGLVVGVFGLIVVSLRGITERTREIGMMRALGFQRSQVITAVVVEIFAVALVGLLIGFANGFILGYGMYTQYLTEFSFNFIIPWGTLGIFIAATVLLSLVAAIIPARRASRIPPSDALRYTG